jgi:spectinomycin phosphotransferase
MLDKPDLQDENIIACLRDEYGLSVAQVAFLPLGADLNTAVYRAITEDESTYFVKLRKGLFDETSVTLPKYLGDLGIRQIIAPLVTNKGRLWANLESFKVILYPFVEGHNGYQDKLPDHLWGEFGAALKSIHKAEIPSSLTGRIRRENYSPRWRNLVKEFLRRIEDEIYDDIVAQRLAEVLRSRRDMILDLVGRADQLALSLQDRSPEFIVCHSDIHAGNILIGDDDVIYIVDWDDPIQAPKERDLMYIGAGLMGRWQRPQEEESLFYRSYGQTLIDPVAMAYYRYERIIEDIAVYCEQLLLTTDGAEDREQSLQYMILNFLPNHTIEIAYKSDRTQGEG